MSAKVWGMRPLTLSCLLALLLLSPAHAITLTELLTQVPQKDADVHLAIEKQHEAEIRHKEVESKRVLFFFKFFNAAILESSAENDAHAANAHTEAIRQLASFTAANCYVDWLKAHLTVAGLTRQVALAEQQHQARLLQFNSGDVLGPEVLEAQTQWQQQQHALIEAETTRHKAQLALQRHGFSLTELTPPQELQGSPPTFQPPKLPATPASQADALSVALKQRPDLQELRYRQASLEKMIRANPLDWTRTRLLNSTVEQLKLRQEKQIAEIRADVGQAWQQLQATEQQRTQLQHMLVTHQRRLEQLKASQAQGFASELEVSQAEGALVAAQLRYSEGQINQTAAQVALLMAIGQPLTPQTASQK
jgi:outer membrane protein TolC